MAVPSFSHTYSKFVSFLGFAQKVYNPAALGASNLASYNSSSLCASTLITAVGGVTAYTVTLPVGAIMTSIDVADTTAFSAGATIALGSALAATDIHAALSIVASSTAAPPLIPQVSTVTGNGQTVFLTLGGAPAAGVGYVTINYFNPAVIVNGVLD